MKELHGSASASVSASAQASFDLLADVEGYPNWYPEAVRRVEVLERSGDRRATRARAVLHVAYGPLVRDFDLTLAVAGEAPRWVKLTRLPNEPSDPEQFEVRWRIAPERIEVELDATLSVPRLVPVGGIGESVAAGFVAAAARTLTSRSP